MASEYRGFSASFLILTIKRFFLAHPADWVVNDDVYVAVRLYVHSGVLCVKAAAYLMANKQTAESLVLQ